MSMSQIVTAVLFANGLTFAFLYCMWRLRRDEKDMRAILGALVLLAIALAVTVAGRSQSEALRRTEDGSTVSQSLSQR